MTPQDKHILKWLRGYERRRRTERIVEQKERRKERLASKAPPAAGEPATVIAIYGAACRVRTAGWDRDVRAIPGLAPGDNVLIEGAAAREILPRRTVLSRPDPANHDRERVLAANIDVVVNVVSVVSPPLRQGLIDRYLVAIAKGGAEPLICVNKIDLLLDASALDVLDVYRAIGVPVVTCSAETGSGLDALRAAIDGRLCVFTGHSGVGKSSLLNALAPHLALKTAEVGLKGRHTTTASNLYELPGGTRIIDTPGIRELGLWQIAPSDLWRYFPDFRGFPCRFRNCTHVMEPGCGVRDAADPARYRAYLRLLEGLD